jgi:hypothetical protein
MEAPEQLTFETNEESEETYCDIKSPTPKRESPAI